MPLTWAPTFASVSIICVSIILFFQSQFGDNHFKETRSGPKVDLSRDNSILPFSYKHVIFFQRSSILGQIGSNEWNSIFNLLKE